MKLKRIFYTLFLMLFIVSCEDVLDIEPTDIISADQLFSDPGGVKVFMANLYFQTPVEDFAYFPQNPNNDSKSVFRYNGSSPNNGGFAQAMHTDNAMHSEFGTGINPNDQWWEQSYKLIRDVNALIDIVPELDIFDEEKQLVKAEASFIRAYTYYALAKRYGGVPLILSKQEYTSDVESLKVPRSTEKETWDLVLAECDTAAKYLPESWPAGDDRRATKYAALALKSRAALHAASIAKYWDRAPLTGEAVDKGLVGIAASEAVNYYQDVVDASEEIINSGLFGLYGAGETDPAVAAENFRKLFENPNIDNNEVIFAKGYTLVGNENTANNYEIWYNPNQVRQSWPHPGRMNPTLDLVELYESYSGTPGDTTLFETASDGEDYFGFDPAKNYVRYDTPYQIFEARDARLWGTVILPGTTWKNTEIVIQAGLIEPDGTPKLYQKTSYTLDGTQYHTYGAADVSMYSGFDPAGGNHSRTGFLFKKFLKEGEDVIPGWNNGTLDWIDIRYAEVLLNYAEAVVEGEFSDKNTDAANALNEVRSRAAHSTTVPLTLDNVLRERRVELAFEHKRYYDLVRRREYHIEFDNRLRHALLPVLDLRGAEPKYIFIRDEVGGQTGKSANPQTWQLKWYYRSIPGTGTSGLEQNPQY
ncbi:MAG: RagB/SusD family nutrient uptake outer membrane protein [Bacteroidales bacterium]